MLESLTHYGWLPNVPNMQEHIMEVLDDTVFIQDDGCLFVENKMKNFQEGDDIHEWEAANRIY